MKRSIKIMIVALESAYIAKETGIVSPKIHIKEKLMRIMNDRHT